MRVQRRFNVTQNTKGRLLSEFLVALALLFLTLGANLAILHSATKSSHAAALSARALELARDGMEQLIADPKRVISGPQSLGVGVGKGAHVQAGFSRKAWLTPLGKGGLGRATVTVEWDGGVHSVRLERYVRTD